MKKKQVMRYVIIIIKLVWIIRRQAYVFKIDFPFFLHVFFLKISSSVLSNEY